jgi:ATP-dependent Clp protease ATP-binding subunit ClpA
MLRAMTHFSETAEKLLQQARALAEARDHEFIGTEHLLLAMARQPSDESLARRVLDEAGATVDVRTRVEALIGE